MAQMQISDRTMRAKNELKIYPFKLSVGDSDSKEEEVEGMTNAVIVESSINDWTTLSFDKCYEYNVVKNTIAGEKCNDKLVKVSWKLKILNCGDNGYVKVMVGIGNRGVTQVKGCYGGEFVDGFTYDSTGLCYNSRDVLKRGCTKWAVENIITAILLCDYDKKTYSFSLDINDCKKVEYFTPQALNNLVKLKSNVVPFVSIVGKNQKIAILSIQESRLNK